MNHLLVSPQEPVPLVSTRRAQSAQVHVYFCCCRCPTSPQLLPCPGVSTESNCLRVSPEIYKLSAAEEGNDILLLLPRLSWLSETDLPFIPFFFLNLLMCLFNAFPLITTPIHIHPTACRPTPWATMCFVFKNF